MSEQGLLLTSIDELRKLCVELDPIVTCDLQIDSVASVKCPFSCL